MKSKSLWTEWRTLLKTHLISMTSKLSEFGAGNCSPRGSFVLNENFVGIRSKKVREIFGELLFHNFFRYGASCRISGGNRWDPSRHLRHERSF